jgi:hypothetical protein
MIKTTTILVEEKEHHKFCDDCGVEIPIGLACGVAKCAYCGKDLCNKCIAHEDESWGDYRGTLWCKKCWEIGEEFRPLINSAQEEIESLYELWQDRCKSRHVPSCSEDGKHE